MTTADPAVAGDFAGDALHGAVVAGIVIPVLQYILLAFLDAFPESTFDASVTLVAIIALIGLNLLPLLSAVASIVAAYVVAGPVGVFLYVVMSVAASAVLGNPVIGITVLLVATFGMALWIFVQVQGQKRTRRGGLR